MSDSALVLSLDQLPAWCASTTEAAGKRTLIGLVGPPGAGKSTVAAFLEDQLQPTPPIVPMDGFHLAHQLLEKRGQVGVKGAPETFDVDGFVSLLGRIRDDGQSTIYAPEFHRSIENPIANAIPINPADRVVIIEGNYLLLDGPWQPVRSFLTKSVYVVVDDEVRRARLIARHVAMGRSTDDAERFVATSDEANARVVAATRDRAQALLMVD